MKRFFENSPYFPKNKRGEVHLQRVKDILTHVLYAGYLDKPEWGIHLVKVHHEPPISFETFQKIQQRLNGQAKAPVRKDINEDFPLRGFVACVSFGTPMTSCWSRGIGGLYAYYLCHGKNNDGTGRDATCMENPFDANKWKVILKSCSVK